MEATAAGVARSVVKAVFGALAMPAGLTYDVAVGVSELATNVYVHALTVEYGGRWGIHRTRSRLGAYPVAGKAVFLTVPLPPGHPAGRRGPPTPRWRRGGGGGRPPLRRPGRRAADVRCPRLHGHVGQRWVSSAFLALILTIARRTIIMTCRYRG
jgi:hypothetical protein